VIGGVRKSDNNDLKTSNEDRENKELREESKT
jgi:hypothetical protein